jgi:phosphoglycolate phosphatase
MEIYTHNIEGLLIEDKQVKALHSPEVIALDLDLTLHDVIAHYDYSINETLLHFGYNALTQEQLTDIGHNFSTTKDMLAKFLPDSVLDEALEYYMNHFISREIPSRSLLPGAKELLYLLRKRMKLPIIGVTNSEESIAKKILSDLGMLNWFDYVIGIREGHLPKPHTQMLLASLSIISAKPGPHIWVVGDRASDTKCAKDASCTAIRFYHKIKPEDNNADFFINDHFALYSIIVSKII